MVDRQGHAPRHAFQTAAIVLQLEDGAKRGANEDRGGAKCFPDLRPPVVIQLTVQLDSSWSWSLPQAQQTVQWRMQGEE